MTTEPKVEESDIAPSAAKRGGKFLVVLLLSILPFGALLLLRFFAFQPFNIPSTSNHPSLMQGDYIFVSKLAYRFGDPERGDIAVFKLPSDPTVDYVKRVVGLPGDRIQMKGGIVYLNGQALPQTPVVLAPEFSEDGVRYFRETLPDERSYVVANSIDNGAADNTEEYVVPPAHYFMMGDNRDNSQDSRYLDAVGYVPREYFVGRYALRFWNSEGFPLSHRPQEIPAGGQ